MQGAIAHIPMNADRGLVLLNTTPPPVPVNIAPGKERNHARPGSVGSFLEWPEGPERTS
jgi:hypothetical protein